jgi:tRNA-modifying protein YgfZ
MNPLNGYEALRTAAAWRDLGSRGRILVRGEDNARLLHALSSNHIQGLGDGDGCYAFFLNAQGRIQADAYILRSGADLLIDCEASVAQALYEHIDKYIIADDVTLENLAQSHASLALEGPESLSVTERLGVPVPPHAMGVLPFAGGFVARLNETGFEGLRLIVPTGSRPDFGDVPEASEEAWEIVRHEQGKPRFGAEILERHLVQETRLMHGVHFNKGCYLGQEIVERVRARGAVHKGMAALSIEGNPPAAGAEVLSGEAKAGQILSAAYSPAEGRTVAFAMLGVDYLSGQKALEVASAKAELRASNAFAAAKRRADLPASLGSTADSAEE